MYFLRMKYPDNTVNLLYYVHVESRVTTTRYLQTTGTIKAHLFEDLPFQRKIR